MAPYRIPQDTLAEFQSHPWTASFVSNEDYYPVETLSRTHKKDTGEDAFFGDTIASKTTIPHCLTLRRKSEILQSPPKSPPAFPPPPAKWPSPSTTPDIITLFDFTGPGINGHPGVVHGGVVSTLLDEIMSLAIATHIPDYDFNQADQRGRMFTMQLDVRFKRPVISPAKTVVKATCVASDGRKFWMRAQLIQEEPDEGKSKGQLEWAKRKLVCADAIAFFILVRDQKL